MKEYVCSAVTAQSNLLNLSQRLATLVPKSFLVAVNKNENQNSPDSGPHPIHVSTQGRAGEPGCSVGDQGNGLLDK